MKTLLLVVGISAALSMGPAFGQFPPPARIPPPQLVQKTAQLTRFDLDFPGGTPKELVSAIQKALGRPLNAIVPDEYADFKLPALKMSNVNVQQLFSALQEVSHKSEAVETSSYYGGGQFGGYRSMQVVSTSYGFRPGPGETTDDTIWYFYAEKPALPTISRPNADKVCRFYSLKPYLDQHIATVDDITTAIETGWKMLGETSPPKISFHKDTKLLIAVGEPNKLETIDAVLKALDSSKAPSAAKAEGSSPKPATPAKGTDSSKPDGGE